MRHELVRLEALIDWDFFKTEWAGFFPSHTGRPATSPRLVAGLLSLAQFRALGRGDHGVVAGEPLLVAPLWGRVPLVHRGGAS
jgi:IS5 family transposase